MSNPPSSFLPSTALNVMQVESPPPVLLPEPRQLPASAGIDWIQQAWLIFKQRPGIWMAMLLTILAISFLFTLMPLVGNIAFHFLTMLFLGGWIISCDIWIRSGRLEFKSLFSGFTHKFKELGLLGLIYLCITFMMGLTAALLLAPFEQINNPTELPNALLPVFMLSVVGFSILLLMCSWFSTQLVVLHDISPLQAIRMSFKGCLKNLLPLLSFIFLFGILFFVLSIITLGLGLLVLLPLYYLVYYSSYRDVCTEPALKQ